jgi:hypothetical protein
VADKYSENVSLWSGKVPNWKEEETFNNKIIKLARKSFRFTLQFVDAFENGLFEREKWPFCINFKGKIEVLNKKRLNKSLTSMEKTAQVLLLSPKETQIKMGIPLEIFESVFVKECLILSIGLSQRNYKERANKDPNIHAEWYYQISDINSSFYTDL